MWAFIVKLAEAKQDMNFDAIHDGQPSMALWVFVTILIFYVWYLSTVFVVKPLHFEVHLYSEEFTSHLNGSEPIIEIKDW